MKFEIDEMEELAENIEAGKMQLAREMINPMCNLNFPPTTSLLLGFLIQQTNLLLFLFKEYRSERIRSEQ